MKKAPVTMILLATLLLSALPLWASPPDGQGIEEAVQAYIDAQMPWPRGTARIEFLSPHTEGPAVKKQAQLQVEPVGNGEFIGDIAFRVRSMEGSRLVRTDTVRVRIEVLRDRVTAARALAAGTVLTEGDLRIVPQWVRRIAPEAPATAEEVLGKQLTMSVRPGTEFLTRLLKDPPLVKKGKIVKVVFDNGPMRIVTSGVPEEDGVAGAIIRVRNLTSNKIIYARVLGQSLVGVEI